MHPSVKATNEFFRDVFLLLKKIFKMVKKLFGVVILLMVCNFSFAQSEENYEKEDDTKKFAMPVNANGKIEYTGIVNVDSTSAETLFSRAKIAIAKLYVVANTSAIMGDENSKTIIRNTVVKIYGKKFLGMINELGNVHFTISIQCKDNKYRYVVNDFVHDEYGKAKNTGGALERDKPLCGFFLFPRSDWNLCKKNTDESVKKFIADFYLYMTGKTTNSTDNW